MFLTNHAINFNNSSFCWHTHTDSMGFFKVKARLTVETIYGEESYFLMSGIAAGNVYGSTMTKEPPYLYQALFAEKDCKIFRLPIGNKNVFKQSSTQENKKYFKNIQLNLNQSFYNIVSTIEDIYNYTQKGFQLTSQIKYVLQGGQNVTLEFPVEHLNINYNESKWQIETGLLPYFPSAHIHFDLDKCLLAHYYINQNHQTEIVIHNDDDTFTKDVLHPSSIQLLSLTNY